MSSPRKQSLLGELDRATADRRSRIGSGAQAFLFNPARHRLRRCEGGLN
jgi:hypothetical protein